MTRFGSCDPRIRRLHPGKPYVKMMFTCHNTGASYAMGWLPDYCPKCGGELSEEAQGRYMALVGACCDKEEEGWTTSRGPHGPSATSKG